VSELPLAHCLRISGTDVDESGGQVIYMYVYTLPHFLFPHFRIPSPIPGLLFYIYPTPFTSSHVTKSLH